MERPADMREQARAELVQGRERWTNPAETSINLRHTNAEVRWLSEEVRVGSDTPP